MFSLADGFTSYTTSTKTINQQVKVQNGDVVLSRTSQKERKGKLTEAESAITLAKDSADIFLSPGGNLVQNLLVEESALAASAQFKDTVRVTFVEGPQRFRDALPFGVGSIFPPLPFEDQVAPFLRKTEKEIKAQQLGEKIIALAYSTDEESTPATAAVMESLRGLEPEQAALIVKELRESLPRYGPLVAQLGGKFVATLLNTASMNIETTLTELELAGESPDGNVRSAFKGLSTVALRGATAMYPQKNTDQKVSSLR